MNSLTRRTGLVVAGAVVLATLGGASGAVARSLVTSAQIKDHTIRTVDMHKGSIKSRQILNGTIKAADLRENLATVARTSRPAVSEGPVTSLGDLLCTPGQHVQAIAAPTDASATATVPYVFTDYIVGGTNDALPGDGTVTATPVLDDWGQLTGFTGISAAEVTDGDVHQYSFRIVCG